MKNMSVNFNVTLTEKVLWPHLTDPFSFMTASLLFFYPGTVTELKGPDWRTEGSRPFGFFHHLVFSSMWNHLSPLLIPRDSKEGGLPMAVSVTPSSLRMQSPGGCTGSGAAGVRLAPSSCRGLQRARGRAAPAAARAGRVPPRWVALAFLSLRLLFHYKSKVIFF